MREFSDGGGLAGAVDADHEDDEGLLAGVDLERLRHRRQHLLDLDRDDVLDFVRRDRLVVAPRADGLRNPHRDRGAEVGAQQHVLDVVEHGAVELALSDEVGDRGPERGRGALQPVGQAAPPAQLGGLGGGIVHGGGVLAVPAPKRKS
ncbi:hypothetical protein ACVWW7_003811 [Bradyrhizobium sp. LM6.9]